MSEESLAEIAAELQEIRVILGEMHDLQKKAAQDVAMCPHGATGVCMACILPIIDNVAFTIAERL